MDHLLLESEGTKILKSITIEFVVHVSAAGGTVRVSAMHTGSQCRVAGAQLLHGKLTTAFCAAKVFFFTIFEVNRSNASIAFFVGIVVP